MATITIKSRCPVQPTAPEVLRADLHDDEPWKRNLPMLLIRLGQKLIEHGYHQDSDDCWLKLAQVTSYCRRYNLSWPGPMKGREFECDVYDLFSKSGEVRGAGIRVEYKTANTERRRLPIILLKFSRVYPDGMSN